MIIYLHGFDSNSPGNHEKLQLQFIDPDVRLISYSTRHPKHDMQFLLKECDKLLQQGSDAHPLICGVGRRLLGGTHRLPLRHAPRYSIPTCFLMKTWKARSTGRKSILISPPNASATSVKRTATAA